MTPEEYLKAIEKERRLDPRAFAEKVKALTPAPTGTRVQDGFSQVPAGQTVPSRYKPPSLGPNAALDPRAAGYAAAQQPSSADWFGQVPAGQTPPSRYGGIDPVVELGPNAALDPRAAAIAIREQPSSADWFGQVPAGQIAPDRYGGVIDTSPNAAIDPRAAAFAEAELAGTGVFQSKADADQASYDEYLARMQEDYPPGWSQQNGTGAASDQSVLTLDDLDLQGDLPVDDPRIAMRESLAQSFLDNGGTVQELADFLGSDILKRQKTVPWFESDEFAALNSGPAGPTGPAGPAGPTGPTDFGGPGETKPEMTPVGNFVDSQTEALDVIQRRLDEITNATNAARDSGIEQIDIIQSEAQKQLDATFANQYTVLDPMTGEPLEEGEMDRLLATWTDEKSKSKTARAADKAVIGNLALSEGIVSSQMEFDTIDTLYGDQIDAQYQYIDSLYRIGKLAKDDRDAMLTNIMAGYKSDLTNKAIEIILGAEIDTADRRSEVREDALASRDVAEYLGADPNAIFGGMRGDIPIGEMAYQTGERVAGQEFAAGESELDRLAQGINPATGRPYGFMTQGPYAGMTIGEANAARQEKDLTDLQMSILQAEEDRAVDAVGLEAERYADEQRLISDAIDLESTRYDTEEQRIIDALDLEAERYEEMWRDTPLYDRFGAMTDPVGTGWYDIGINPATGEAWAADDDVYGEPIPSGFYAADFDNMNLPNIEVIDGQYWMTPSQFSQVGPVLETNLAKQQDPFGDLQDPQMNITAAVLQLASPAKYTEWQNAVNKIYLIPEGQSGAIPSKTPADVVWSQVVSAEANVDPEAAKVWANLTKTEVMGNTLMSATPKNTPFTAYPDGTVVFGTTPNTTDPYEPPKNRGFSPENQKP